METKIGLDNIKCDFFIPKIFEIIPKYRRFRIVNYNKNLQKNLDINFSDFIQIYELYGPTSIEIIPAKNKYGKFINVKEEEKLYYHVYFNNSKKDIKDKYIIKEEDKTEKIIIIDNNKVTKLIKLFNECNCIESITVKKVYNKKIYVPCFQDVHH